MDARFPLSSTPSGLLAPGAGRSPRSLADLPALGVGLTYSSGLDPLLEEQPDLVDLLEIEPQTHWLQPEPDAARYRPDREVLAHLAALPCAKLVHGIGNPIGGSRGPELRQLALFARAARELGAAWASEHLSFNRAAGRGRVFHTGFLLPPRQTPAGAAAAAASVRTMSAALDVPLLFETGVSYLRPRADELTDGAFVRAVAEEADCGILLDLHNVWTNAENGRQGVEEFLAELPLERVIEIHLAGGEKRGGFWVDSHSGAIPAPVLALARELVPRLPQLKALVFELFPSYVPVVGLDLVRREVERLRALWETRGSAPSGAAAPRPRAAALPTACEDARGWEEARGWEDALGALVVGRRREGALDAELSGDAGLGIVRELVGEFRASMIASTLPLTIRLLLLVRGTDALLELFAQHAAASTPELFASTEAERFATLLAGLALDVPYLADVLGYERAALRANLAGETVVVPFRHDPLVVLRSLGEGRLPDAPRAGSFEVELAV
jgi:uncharacterized protein